MTYPILWASNSPTTGTGYGQQTAQVVPRLKGDGHPVAIASNYGVEGAIVDWNGIRQFPRGFGQYSEDVLTAYQQAWSAENDADALLVTLFDVWVYEKASTIDQVPRIASWVPIDHSPAPPKVVDWLARANVTPIAMSRYGQQMIERADIECLYVPHALEKVFTPTRSVTAGDREMTGHDIMRVDDSRWVILMNAANKGMAPARKSWDTNFMSVAILMERHDDIHLHVHSESMGSMGGINLPELANAVGIPEDRITFTEQYSYRMGLRPEALAAMYTAADCLLACSLGEGFGIPQVEAQACGLPIVTSGWSACKELVGDGWTVDGQPSWDPMQRAWWMIPSIPSTVDALEQAYQRGRGISQQAIDFSAQYDADFVFDEYWRPALKALA